MLLDFQGDFNVDCNEYFVSGNILKYYGVISSVYSILELYSKKQLLSFCMSGIR